MGIGFLRIHRRFLGSVTKGPTCTGAATTLMSIPGGMEAGEGSKVLDAGVRIWAPAEVYVEEGSSCLSSPPPPQHHREGQVDRPLEAAGLAQQSKHGAEGG